MMFNLKMSLVVLAASGALWSVPASAQSFCDLVPASEVKAALGITGNLMGKPTREGGNGCAYSTGEANVPNVVDANSSDYAGIIKTVADTRFASPGPNEERVSGLGEAAIYTSNTYSHRQSIFFRAKGKYVNLYVSAGGTNGVPKAAIISLATLVVSKPINTLKDPPS
jgi:hypothetical protein